MRRTFPLTDSTDASPRDDGAILPLVLVAMMLISVVVVAVTTYVSADLRYGNVVEERAD